jgi:predicted acyltransferase
VEAKYLRVWLNQSGPFKLMVPQFEHVRWEGLHFFDLIWPLFMFIVGVSAFVIRKSPEGSTKRLLHAARRAASFHPE